MLFPGKTCQQTIVGPCSSSSSKPLLPRPTVSGAPGHSAPRPGRLAHPPGTRARCGARLGGADSPSGWWHITHPGQRRGLWQGLGPRPVRGLRRRRRRRHLRGVRRVRRGGVGFNVSIATVKCGNACSVGSPVRPTPEWGGYTRARGGCRTNGREAGVVTGVVPNVQIVGVFFISGGN